MKKLFLLLIALVLVFGAASADQYDEVREAVTHATDEELHEVREMLVAELEIIDQELAKRNTGAEDGVLLKRDFGSSEVKLVKLSLGNQRNKNVLIAELTFTNKSDEKQSFALTATVEAFQNGIELSRAYFVDGIDTDMNSAEIKKGATVTVYKTFEVRDINTPVEIDICEWITYGDTPVSGTFTIPSK